MVVTIVGAMTVMVVVAGVMVLVGMVVMVTVVVVVLSREGWLDDRPTHVCACVCMCVHVLFTLKRRFNHWPQGHPVSMLILHPGEKCELCGHSLRDRDNASQTTENCQGYTRRPGYEKQNQIE